MNKIIMFLSLALCACVAQSGYAIARGDMPEDRPTMYDRDYGINRTQSSLEHDRAYQGAFLNRNVPAYARTVPAYSQEEGMPVQGPVAGGDDCGCTQPTGECYCKFCKQVPEYYKVQKCCYVPKYSYQQCCRYVPQYYEKCCCRYVPQYYNVTCCRYVPETYYTCQCRYCPQYYCETHCRYRPCYYWKHTCGQSCATGGCANGSCGVR